MVQKRYWLRGGLVVFALYILAGGALAFYELYLAPQNEMSGLFTALYFISPGQFVFGIDGYQAFISLAASAASYFAIGVLIGTVYGK